MSYNSAGTPPSRGFGFRQLTPEEIARIELLKREDLAEAQRIQARRAKEPKNRE
jgi:hypothetical protein